MAKKRNSEKPDRRPPRHFILRYSALQHLPIFAIVVFGLIARIIAMIYFAAPITEDSDGYILAADYMRGIDPASREFVGYRQIGYPMLINFFRAVSDLPIWSLLCFQVAISSLSIYLVYRISQQAGVRWYLALIPSSFLALHAVLIRYTIVVAPETLALFLILVGLFITARRLRRENTKAQDHLELFFAGLAMASLAAVKEQFLPLAIIIFAILFIDIFRRQAKSRALAAVATYALSFSILFFANVALTRDYLQTEKWRPMCVTWPAALLRYYVDFDKPTHAEYKAKIKDYVTHARSRLEDWNFTFGRGNEKVNSCEGVWCAETEAYAQKNSVSTDRFDVNCAYQKFGAEILFEALESQWPHFIQHWLYPELYRGFFLDHSSNSESFVYTTLRMANQKNTYFQEFADENYHYLFVNRSTDPVARYYTDLYRENSFSRHDEFSWLFFGFVLIVLPINLWRRWSHPETQTQLLLLAHTMTFMLMIAAIVWFYERYTIYVVFAIAILATYAIESVFRSISWAFEFASARRRRRNKR